MRSRRRASAWPVQAPADNQSTTNASRSVSARSTRSACARRRFRELHQDGDPPKNAAGRIPSFRTGPSHKLRSEPEPAAHDPVDRLRLRKKRSNMATSIPVEGIKGALPYCFARCAPPPSRSREIRCLPRTRHITEEGTKPRHLKDRGDRRQLLGPGLNRSYHRARRHHKRGDCPGTGQKPRDKATASYCTSFGDLHGDGNEPSWVRRFSAAALRMVCRAAAAEARFNSSW